MMLTQKEVDNRLAKTSFIRREDYDGSFKLTRVFCSLCKTEWKTTLNNIFSGSRCPTCHKNSKMKIFDNACQNQDISRIGIYVNTTTSILVKCNVCSRKWLANFGHIVGGGGCSQCSYRDRSLTNEEIDRRLIGKNIIRLGDYIVGKPLLLRCLEPDCGREWSPQIVQVISVGKGCLDCGRKNRVKKISLNTEYVDNILASKNIQRLDPYTRTCDRIHFKCLICDYGSQQEWYIRPTNIIHMDEGCPICNDKSLNNEEIDSRLAGRKIKRIGDYVNAKTKIMFKCLEDTCHHIWEAMPGNVCRTTGCPKCSLGKNHHIVHLMLETNNVQFEAEKYLNDICSISDIEYENIHIDFYLPNHNSIIEYNGRQHYEPACFGGITKEAALDKLLYYQQPRDMFVKQFCENHNIHLIIIDGRKYKGSKLEGYMNNELIPMIRKLAPAPEDGLYRDTSDVDSEWNEDE